MRYAAIGSQNIVKVKCSKCNLHSPRQQCRQAEGLFHQLCKLLALVVGQAVSPVVPIYENGIMTRVRMDKWLWAARFFKTRSLPARACEFGRIEVKGQPTQASRG